MRKRIRKAMALMIKMKILTICVERAIIVMSHYHVLWLYIQRMANLIIFVIDAVIILKRAII